MACHDSDYVHVSGPFLLVRFFSYLGWSDPALVVGEL